MHILIAEDCPIMQRVTSRFANRFNFKPTVVETGDAAIRIFDPRFRVVITDFNMPPGILNGIEVVRYIKSIAPQVTCVIASANDITCPEADIVLRKPFNYKQLFSRLANIPRS